MLTSPSNALHSTPHFLPIRRSRLCRSRNFTRFHSGERSSAGGKLCSLSLLSASGASKFSVRALIRPDVTEDADSIADGTLAFPNHISVKIPFGNREILVETGLMGRQASSAVTVTDGETIVYTSVCLADVPSEPSDFLPLYVHYQERFSAVGRTSGGFFKREGRTKDHEVLICRLIDRPLRPTMPKGFYNETQILSWVLSYDGLHAPDALAVTSAGIAVALSEVPNSKAVAGVRVGLIGGEFIVNPTVKEMEESQLDLFLAGTDTAILTIEGYSNFLPEEMLLQAVKVGQVKIMANDVASLERAKAIISGLTMVPAVGDIYRNCEIKSMAPYGAFVEIVAGREGLCHISELSAEWLAKPEDAFKVGDRIDVKLIEVNEKGQLRLSVRALLPESETDKDSQKQQPTGDSTKDKGSPRKYVNTSSKDRASPGASKIASGDELSLEKKDVRRATGGSNDKPMKSNSSNEEERSSLVNGEATIS